MLGISILDDWEMLGIGQRNAGIGVRCRGAPEPKFSDPAGTGTSRNWYDSRPGFPAGTGTFPCDISNERAFDEDQYDIVKNTF